MFFIYSVLARCGPNCQPPKLPPNVIMYEPFKSLDFPKNWSTTKNSSYDGIMAIYPLNEPTSCKFERALVMKTPRKRYAFSRYLPEEVENSNKTLVIQFEYRFPRYMAHSSGLVNLYSRPFHPHNLTNYTMPTIVFGVDVVDSVAHMRFDVLFLSKHTRFFEKHSLKNPPEVRMDGLNHLVTLVINPDDIFKIYFDTELVMKGDMFQEFDPPFGGYEFIPDPKDKKPDDWDEREYIQDEAAVKPDDWDDNAKPVIKNPSSTPPEGWLLDEEPFIPDPNAKAPEDWDELIFGPYVAPTIANPKCANAPGCGKYEPGYINNPNYRGVWKRPIIKNPNYKGKWAPKMVRNKYHYKPKMPHWVPPIIGIGFEFYTQDGGLAFKNLLLKYGEEGLNVSLWENFRLRKKEQVNPQSDPNSGPGDAPGFEELSSGSYYAHDHHHHHHHDHGYHFHHL